MTPDEIRIAMSELEGYRKLAAPRAFNFMWSPGHISRREGDWETPSGNVISEDLLPNYPDDLKAVARVALKHAHQYGPRYCMKLRQIVVRDSKGKDYERSEIGLLCDVYFYEATAPQRCEAILKATNKWKEGE